MRRLSGEEELKDEGRKRKENLRKRGKFALQICQARDSTR
jgi:hypothetical protein